MKWGRLALLCAFSMAILFAAPFIGVPRVPLSELFVLPQAEDISVLWDLRVPRVLLGWVTGATLAICGMVFQALFRNSLASPDLLGVSTGASLGAVIYIRLGLSFTLFGVLSGLSLAAFLGALLATFAIYTAGSLPRGGMSEATLLLTGVAMSFFFSSMNMIIQYSGGYIDTFRMMRWSMGGIRAVKFAPVYGPLAALAVIFVTAIFTAPELDLFVAGEDIAESRGVSVSKLRRRLFVLVSIVVGVNVAVCGPIGFVGLMAPHICRRLVGADHRNLTIASLLFGGAFLVVCDTGARTLWAPGEVPAGILTSCLGSLFFLWLLFRGRERG